MKKTPVTSAIQKKPSQQEFQAKLQAPKFDRDDPKIKQTERKINLDLIDHEEV